MTLSGAASFLVAKVLTCHDRSDVMVLWQHLVVSMLLLPFAVFLFLGYFMFSTMPGGWTMVGGVVILASTLMLARHESRQA